MWRILLRRRYIHEWGVVLVVCAGLVSSIVYANIQTYDPVLTPARGYSDTSDYVALYYGEPVMGHRGYRPFVPWLARAVPDLPSGFFSSDRQVTDAHQVGIKFGVVNWAFLLGTCLTLYAFQRSLKLSFWASLTGIVLFLSNRSIVRGAGLPMTDTALYFFLMLALSAIFWRRPVLLLVAGVLGALANELTLLCLPAVLLTPAFMRDKLRLGLALLPAIAVRMFILDITTAMLDPAPAIFIVSGRLLPPITHPFSLTFLWDSLAMFRSANGWLAVLFSFGLTWLVAGYGWWRADPPQVLRRWIWMLPIIACGILLANGSAGNMVGCSY